MSVRSIRERINLSLYENKTIVLKRFRALSLFFSVIAIATLTYYHGFSQTPESSRILLFIIQASFGFYVLHYLLKIFYDFHPLWFIRYTWFEALIVLLLIVEGISFNFFNTLTVERFFLPLGIEHFADWSAIFIQIYLLLVVLFQIFKSSTRIPDWKIHPAKLFLFAFVAMDLGGALLLMLPEMTTIKGSMPVIDALFTSTSALCVTGLIVVDTATYFTFKGQLIIMMLIKVGGINIISFAAFLAIATKFGVGIKHHSVIEGFINKDSVFSLRSMFGKIVFWSLIIELIGSILIYIFWSHEIPFSGRKEKIFFSVFHAVSAFNNAGFSLFTDGLYNEYVRFNFLVHIVFAVIIFFGSLGFLNMFDIFSVVKLRERLKYPWKDLEMGSKIALYLSIGLISSGAALFFLLEYGNSLNEMNFLESVITSVFQAVVPRTAGFNTVDYGKLTDAALVMTICLMFIGASSGSTGGGIKTSTFAIIFASAYSTIKGKKNTELFYRTIPDDLIQSAFSILLFFSGGIIVSVFLLSITETHILEMPGRSLLDIVFETTSAYATVGLSTGITSSLSTAGKLIITFSMFIGRVGTLTLAYSIWKTVISTEYKYPVGRTMVG